MQMDWTKIATHPLGLAAFVLALVFGAIGVKLNARQKPWFLPAALILAATVLFGSLYLAHRQISADEQAKKSYLPQVSVKTFQQPVSLPAPPLGSQSLSPSKSPPQTIMHQETHGAGSPAIQGIQGNVTIITDPSGKNK